MKKRLLGLALALTLCLSPLAVLAQEQEPAAAMVMMGYDAQEGRVWEDNLFFDRMAEVTGVSFTFDQYSDSEAYTKAKEKLASGGDLPDVLFKADLTSAEELSLAESGVLMDLTPLLQEHAPNLWALLEANPDWREAITLPDGKIVALPMLARPARQICLWINQHWLEVVGMSAPTTTDELTEVLRAFRDQDPNGNYTADEVPLLMVGPWEAKWLMPAFGLVANDYNVYLDGQGKVQFAPFDPAYRDFLEYLKMLLDEGLLYSDAFRTQHTILALSESEVNPPRAGVMLSFAPYTLINMDVTMQYDALLPLTYEGRQEWRDYLGDVWRGTFAITSACEDPAAALKWVDYLYTDEGATLAYMGLENQEWSYTEPPRWNYLLDEYRPYSYISNEALISDSAMLPGVDPEKMWATIDNDAEQHVIAQSEAVAEYAKSPMPSLYPNAGQLAEINEIHAVLGQYVDTELARFATGERALDDEQYAQFQAELEQLGATRLVEIWQEIYDGRYGG